MVSSRTLRYLGIALMAIGAMALIAAVATGEAQFALVVIVPIIYGSGALVGGAILAIFAGVLLLFLSLSPHDPGAEGKPDEGAPRAKSEWGGVILIGPVPIIFGSAGQLRDPRVLAILVIVSLLAMTAFVLMIIW
jgi:uncharacterized protein (TIGR00304 family)